MKTLGIILREINFNNNSYLGTKKEIFSAFNNFDVNVIAIPITYDFEKIKETIRKCDGIVLPGGSAFSENDFKIVKYLYDNNIPTLGICLGMQAMVETYNNRQEYKVENHNRKEEYVHKVRINKNSLLYKIINESTIIVNSRHNFAIKEPYFNVNAVSDDLIIEGIEDPNKRFFLGLQWHPESLNDNNSYKIFKYFVDTL